MLQAILLCLRWHKNIENSYEFILKPEDVTKFFQVFILECFKINQDH